MDDLEFRDHFMYQVFYYLRLAYGDMPESVLESIDHLDRMLCEKLGLDYESIPDFDQ